MQTKQMIGPYTIAFPIKKGLYADTYRVCDDSGKKFFLKLINLAKLSDQQIEGFTASITELELVETLKHPNIMHTVDKDEIVLDGQKFAYMVCDYIIGETVYEKVNREKHCSVYDIKQIVAGVLNGLKYLHKGEEPIIHNEITARNIMLDMSKNVFVPVIIDFGHAQKLTADNAKFYIEGLNPFYLAPEMFRGVYSTRTDLYSVGVMMYYLLFGIFPWYVDLSKVDKDNRTQAILDERKNPLKIPDINIFELDDNFLNIIAKALEQDVDKRFHNAEEFLMAINGEIIVSDSNYQKVNLEKVAETAKSSNTNIKKGNGFADVAGMEELKERLKVEVIDLLRNPEKYKKLRVKIPNGILLYGPPGCGKTYIAEKFAEELGCNYLYVHCSDVASPYIHGGQEKIASLFAKAKENAPTVLFLDELDAMLADRSKHSNVSEYGEVNEFLTQLNNCAENQIIVVGATNNPKGIDPAALRSGRLDIKVYVPAPDKDARIQLFKLYLKDIADEDVDYDLLSEKTDGYVSKDVCVLVNKAALVTAQNDQELIKMETLLNANEKSKGELPSVSKDIIKKNNKLRDDFEGQSERRPVGFR